MRHLRRILSTAVLALLLSLLPTASGLASSIVVDPIKENVAVESGSLTDLSYTLTNNTESTKAVEVSFAEFTADNNGVPSVVDSPSAADPASWFSASEGNFTLAVDESKTITIRVDVPLDLSAQGFYVMAISRIHAAEEQAAANTTAQEVQTLYSLTVGTPEEDLEIIQISPATQSVAITLRNPANVHTTASGKIDIFVNDEIDATYSVTPVNIFPGKSRATTIALDEAPGEKYEVRVTLAYGRSNRIITGAAFFPEDVTPELLDNEKVQSHAVRNQVEVVQTDDSDRTLLYSAGVVGLLLAVAGTVVVLRRR